MQEESLPRIIKCLHLLSEEEIWRRPNESSNSVGNLVLHLSGNIRQWIVSALGGAPDIRRRSEEFEEKGPISREALIQLLEGNMAEVLEVVENLGAEDLLREYPVQIYREKGISILIHVVEHFSYHTGQISYITKAWKDMDLGYYAGQKL